AFSHRCDLDINDRRDRICAAGGIVSIFQASSLPRIYNGNEVDAALLRPAIRGAAARHRHLTHYGHRKHRGVADGAWQRNLFERIRASPREGRLEACPRGAGRHSYDRVRVLRFNVRDAVDSIDITANEGV